ncbi:MAG: hypothetical protein ACR2M0_08475 [Chloroflexia bacterium]
MKPDDWRNLGVILGALLGGGAIGWRWVARQRADLSPKPGAEPPPAERGAALSVGHIETGGGAVSVGGDVVDRRGGRGA